MTRQPSDLLQVLNGGRVLDVGTGKGQFVQDLVNDLGSYSEIIGIDISDAGAAAFEESFAGTPSVRFLVADAASMPFADESFETVAIAGSLHHVAEPGRVLAEMWRVLASRGAFIVGEQIRDRPTKAELTHVLFHEWSEELLGVAYRPTYRRAELIALVGSLGLANVQSVVDHDTADPFDPRRVAAYEASIDDLLKRSRGRPALVLRGHAIRTRLHSVGMAICKALFLVGIKP
jgi:SAM-dependent methyltransferase